MRRRIGLFLDSHWSPLVSFTTLALLLAWQTVPGWYHEWANDEWRTAPHMRIGWGTPENLVGAVLLGVVATVIYVTLFALVVALRLWCGEEPPEQP